MSLTSKVVSRLEQAGLLVRERGGAVRGRDPDLLLDAWREVYDFSKHGLLRGHAPAGNEYRDGVRCVSPVQAYLDLMAHPERSKEAADHLRRKHLNWGERA